MTKAYQRTRIACYIGYIVQAVIANLPPLLFIIFQKNYGISNARLGTLVLLCFVTQIVVDLLSGLFAEKLGIRACILTADVSAALGLAALSILPRVMTGAPFLALVIPTILYSIGAGFIEVIISPVIESLPSSGKAASMSLLHSFYCWGQVLTILLSTVFFLTIGQRLWYLLPLFWAVVPSVNFFLFLRALLLPIPGDEKSGSMRAIFSSRILLLCFLVMVCSGASELAMAQWASFYAEKALGVSKTVGDLAGPCLFAVLMGLTRAFGGKLSDRWDFTGVLAASAGLCVVCYLLAVFSPLPVFSLLGCAFTGMSIALMWPTTLSLAAVRYPGGGTRMFALLAVFGDIGCSLGPWLTGFLSDRVLEIPGFTARFSSIPADELGLRAGLFAGVLFPAVMLICLACIRRMKPKA